VDGRYLVPLSIISILSGSFALFFDAGYWRRGWTGSDYPLSLIVGYPGFDATPLAVILRSTPAGYCLMIAGIAMLVVCIALLDRGSDTSAHLDRLMK
jgi:hypothetical protein